MSSEFLCINYVLSRCLRSSLCGSTSPNATLALSVSARRSPSLFTVTIIRRHLIWRRRRPPFRRTQFNTHTPHVTRHTVTQADRQLQRHFNLIIYASFIVVCTHCGTIARSTCQCQCAMIRLLRQLMNTDEHRTRIFGKKIRIWQR